MNRKYCLKISIFLGVLILSFVVLANASDELGLEVPDLENIIGLRNDKVDSSGVGGVYSINSRLDQNFLEREFRSSLGEKGFLYRKDKELRFDRSRRLRFDRDNLVIDINLFDLRGRTRVEIEKYFASESPIDLKDIYSLAEKRSLGPEDMEFPDYNHYNKFKLGHFKSLSLVDIPSPPDSEPLVEKSLPSCKGCADGIGPGKIYLSKNTSKQVEGFYRNFFEKNGFVVRKDMNLRLLAYRRVRFERSDMAAEIYLVSRADNSCEVKVVKYANRDDTTTVETNPFAFAVLPKKDNAGGLDFDDIPRPQGSVRWSGTAAKKNITYLIPMTVLETRKFYLQEMPDSGWRLTDEMETGKVLDENNTSQSRASSLFSLFVGSKIDLGEIIRNSYLLEFKSDSAEAKVMIYQNYVRPNAGSIVDIFYSRRNKRR